MKFKNLLGNFIFVCNQKSEVEKEKIVKSVPRDFPPKQQNNEPPC